MHSRFSHRLIRLVFLLFAIAASPATRPFSPSFPSTATATVTATATATRHGLRSPSGRHVAPHVAHTHPYAAPPGLHASQLAEITLVVSRPAWPSRRARRRPFLPALLLHLPGKPARPLNLSVALPSAFADDEADEEDGWARGPAVSINGAPVDDRHRRTVLPRASVRATADRAVQAVFLHDDDHDGDGERDVDHERNLLPVAIAVHGHDYLPLHAGTHPGIYVRRGAHGPSDSVALSLPHQSGAARLVRGGGAIVTDVSAPTSYATNMTTSSGTNADVNLGTPSLPGPGPAPGPGAGEQKLACGAGDAKRYIRLAVAFDNAFCERFGHRVAGAVAQVVFGTNRANIAYALNTCVRLRLVHVEGHCRNERDPYRAIGEHFMLPRRTRYFGELWRVGRAGVNRDVALLASGYADRSPVAGVAVSSSVCLGQLVGAQLVVKGLDARIVAHEVAHLLNASHVASGVMQPLLEGTPLWFAPQSVRQMRAFLATPETKCVRVRTPRRPCAKRNCWGVCRNGVCVVQPKERFGSTPPPKASEQCGATFATGVSRPAGSAAGGGGGGTEAATCEKETAVGPTRLPASPTVTVRVSVAFGKVRAVYSYAGGFVTVLAKVSYEPVPANIDNPTAAAPRGFHIGAFVNDTIAFEWDVATLRRPVGRDGRVLSCCGRRLTLLARVSACTVDAQCSLGYVPTYLSVDCVDACRGAPGTSLAMSASRRCAQCVRSGDGGSGSV